MSLRNKLVGLAGACAVIAWAACAAPAAGAAVCIPCQITPALRLSIQGNQGTRSLLASYGGSDQVDSQLFSYFGVPTEPTVTFQASDSMFQSAAQVQATDTLTCMSNTGWISVPIHYNSAFAAGSVSVTYQPNVRCPGTDWLWASDQTARAVDIYGHATPSVSFNWAQPPAY